MLYCVFCSAVQCTALQGSQSPYQWDSMRARTPLSLVRTHHSNSRALSMLEGGREYGIRIKGGGGSECNG